MDKAAQWARMVLLATMFACAIGCEEDCVQGQIEQCSCLSGAESTHSCKSTGGDWEDCNCDCTEGDERKCECPPVKAAMFKQLCDQTEGTWMWQPCKCPETNSIQDLMRDKINDAIDRIDTGSEPDTETEEPKDAGQETDSDSELDGDAGLMDASVGDGGA